MRWKVKGRRKRFIKSRDGLGEGRWGGGVSRSCTCNFYVDDSLQVKDELTLPDGVTVKDGTFFSPSWFKMFRHSRSLCTTSHLRNIYVFIYLFIYFFNFKVFPRSWYTSPVRGDSYYYYVLYKRCMLPFWLRTHTHTHTVQVSQKHLSCIYIQSTWFLWFSVALMSSVLFMAVQAEKKMPNSDSRSVPQRVNNQTLWLCVNTTLLLNQAFWDPASFKHGSRGNVRKSDPLFYCKTNKHESFVPKRNLKEYISDFSLMKSSLCVFVDLKKLFPEQILIWNTTLRSYLLLSSTFVLQTPLIKPGCGSVISPPGDCCGLNRSPLRSWI